MADAGEEDITTEKDATVLSLKQLENTPVLEFATDKFNSRVLQRSMAKGTPEVVERILGELEPAFAELVQDQFGNYTCQKVFEVCGAERFDRLFAALKDKLPDLAGCVNGTRVVQKVVEQAIPRGKVAELVGALPLHVEERLALSVTGFHVVVKLVELLPWSEAEKLVDHLCGSAEKVGRLGKDQWGVCVLKKCLDRAEGEVRDRLVDAVAANIPSLVLDPFGNYVVQHLVSGAGAQPSPHVGRVVDTFKGKVHDMCMHKFSSNVLEKCLTSATSEDRNKLVNEILNPPHCQPSEGIRGLLFHRYGNYVFQQALEVSAEPQFSLLLGHSRQLVQDVIRSHAREGAALVPQSEEEGGLPADQCRRLAMKLVKRFPQLAEGLELDSDVFWGVYDGFGPTDMHCFGGWAAGAPMPDMYNGMAGWDPTFGAALMGHPTFKGGGRGRKGGGRCAKGKAPWGMAPGSTPSASSSAPPTDADALGETKLVGRVVGFWPNYQITYDEVPVQSSASSCGAGGSGSGRGGRSKNRMRRMVKTLQEADGGGEHGGAAG